MGSQETLPETYTNQPQPLSRREFLRLAGLGAAALLLDACAAPASGVGEATGGGAPRPSATGSPTTQLAETLTTTPAATLKPKASPSPTSIETPLATKTKEPSAGDKKEFWEDLVSYEQYEGIYNGIKLKFNLGITRGFSEQPRNFVKLISNPWVKDANEQFTYATLTYLYRAWKINGAESNRSNVTFGQFQDMIKNQNPLNLMFYSLKDDGTKDKNISSIGISDILTKGLTLNLVEENIFKNSPQFKTSGALGFNFRKLKTGGLEIDMVVTDTADLFPAKYTSTPVGQRLVDSSMAVHLVKAALLSLQVKLDRQLGTKGDSVLDQTMADPDVDIATGAANNPSVPGWSAGDHFTVRLIAKEYLDLPSDVR